MTPAEKDLRINLIQELIIHRPDMDASTMLKTAAMLYDWIVADAHEQPKDIPDKGQENILCPYSSCHFLLGKLGTSTLTQPVQGNLK
jgi:hypothetical protein